jgi:hypothetical protein
MTLPEFWERDPPQTQGLVKVSVTVGDRRALWFAALGGLAAGSPGAQRRPGPVTECDLISGLIGSYERMW